MSITIFEKSNCQGSSTLVSADIRDLKGDPADKPGSIQMTDVRDAVLLFKNDDWHGGALYLRGIHTVSDLGSAKDGGRFGFGNCVRSVRTSPFFLDLNVNVVHSGTDYPALWATETWAKLVIEDVVRRVNTYYTDENVLLQLRIGCITFRDDPKSFNLSGVESWSFPGAWKQPGQVDVVVINQWNKPGKIGLGKLPCFGNTVTVAATVEIDGVPVNVTNEVIAVTLAHELGHYLGLTHGTANDEPTNLMYPDGNIYAPIGTFSLRVDQIREMQDRLASNLARKSDRNIA